MQNERGKCSAYDGDRKFDTKLRLKARVYLEDDGVDRRAILK
jgi:hypothetical protein